MAITRDDIKKRFRYHAPTNEKVVVHEKLRNNFENLAYIVVETTPESREQSLCITALEEALMWANAAVARND